jgi:hypothetical protein
MKTGKETDEETNKTLKEIQIRNLKLESLKYSAGGKFY